VKRRGDAVVPGRRRRSGLVLKAVLSLSLLAWAFSSADVGGAAAVVAELGPVAWLLCILLIIAQLPQLALRWQQVLRASGQALGFGDAFRFTYVGYFFNQLLPTTVGGDFMRGYLAWKRGLPFDAAVASVLLDRATGMAVLALLSLLLLSGPAAAPVFEIELSWIILGLAVLAVAGLVALAFLGAPFRKGAGEGVFVTVLRAVEKQYRALWKRPAAACAVLLLAASSAATGAAGFFAAVWFLELPIGFLHVLGFTSLAIIATIVPVTVAGWGIRENLLVWLMAPYGIPAETALGISIWFGLCATLAAVPGAYVWSTSGSRIDQEDGAR